MNKFTEKERLEMRAAAHKFSEEQRQRRSREFKALSPELQAFAKDTELTYASEMKSELFLDFLQGLKSGKYAKPSEFLTAKAKGLFNGWIFPRKREAALYAADHIVEYPYAAGSVFSRSFRTSRPGNVAARVMSMLNSFSNNQFDADVYDILTDNISEEMIACKYCSYFHGSAMEIAYEIDRGNEQVISYVTEALDGSAGGDNISSIIRGVLMSHNQELYEALGRLLLAARLQEGLRQAICENADMGTTAAFLHILQVIADNDLIRYSSVKRAVGVWVGLICFHPEEGKASDIDRIGSKAARLVYDCLSDPALREEYLASEDSMKIYIALWSLGFYEVHDMLDRIRAIADSGTHHQLLTAGFAAENLCGKGFEHEIASKVLEQHYNEPDTAAVFLPCFMPDVSRYINHVLTGEPISGGWGYAPNKYKENYDQRAYCECSYYFSSNEEAERFYGILTELHNGMKKSAVEIYPCVFPWHSARIDKGDIAIRLACIASALHDNDKIDEAAELISEINGDYGNHQRCKVISLLLTQPETDKQKLLLAQAVCDKAEYPRQTAMKLISHTVIPPESYLLLEGSLRYKNAQMRSNVIKLLYLQEDERLADTVARLISDKKEEKRTAALDIIIQLSEDKKRPGLFNRLRPLAIASESTSTKEKILIERINPSAAAPEKAAPYDASAAYEPVVSQEYLAECKGVFDRYFYPGNDFDPVIEKLTALIIEHDDDEFTESYSGEVATIGAHRQFWTVYPGEETSDIPFRDMWEDFYQKKIKSPELLLRIKLALLAEGDYDAFSRKYTSILSGLIGEELTKGGEYPRRELMLEICNFLMKKHQNGGDLRNIASYTANWFCDRTENLTITVKNSVGENIVYSLMSCYPARELLSPLGFMKTTERFVDIFPLKYRFIEKSGCRGYTLHNRKFQYYGVSMEITLTTGDYIRAAHYGVISKDFMYKCFFEQKLRNYNRTEGFLGKALDDVSAVYAAVREINAPVSSKSRYGSYRAAYALRDLIGKKDPAEFTEEDKALLSFAEEVYITMSEEVLSVELKRGDTMTKYSPAVMSLNRIYGAEKLAAILSALGSETLERSRYYGGYSIYGEKVNIPKKRCLSHLLAVCIPLPEDSAETLRKAISGTDITEKRLIETAMYAPEWIDIIGEYLGWEGFRSACYYFMAHMNESFDDVRTAIIAKFTPLNVCALQAGAFDVDWFKSAYNTLGQKRFDMIYDAAKYISDGTKHSRARKYADAALGKLDPEQTRQTVAEKRNKDLLMAYPLIPLSGEDDLLKRYLYIQQFKKESSKFGSQRSASEKSAAETAMQNLATNAGYADIMRLTLRMEAKLAKDSRELFEERTIGDVTLRLEVSPAGKAEIICQKDGKPLKAIPAKLKKNEHVLRLNEAKKKLTEQYRRTKQMFEQSMEDGTEFTAGELSALMANPVASAIIGSLVFSVEGKLGFLKGNTLSDHNGEVFDLDDSAKATVAHPFHLWKSGHWAEFQQVVFRQEITQPFKQVFRELYVKTPEEAEMAHSLRYAGNQIQPGKTVACLKSRRWIADVESGLQKVYYKENIVARIYALADWFTPTNIEAPTLEWVEFFDRNTGKEIRIKNVPDVIFSEVMRDVDLAVSVAHAGGVDPETSHSTMEMRAALLELTLSLFKLTNVEIKGRHAHITGKLADYTLHLGSGVVHRKGGAMVNILPVHSAHRGKLFLPFADDDPKTAEIITKALFLAEDDKIKDPSIIAQLRA